MTSHTPLHTVLIHHPLTVSVWGGGIRVRGMGYHAPPPQAGRVTDSDGGGRVRVGEGGVGGQAPPSLMCSLYRSTEEVTAKSPPM